MSTNTRRLLGTLVLSAGLVAAGAVPAQSAVPPAPDIPVLTGIRTGLHPTFDRIVLDVVLSMGIGMRQQSSVKLFTLTGPTHVVIDVGH